MVEHAATRVAVVTGASRAAGIGFAIARRLLADGFAVLVHGWPAVDAPAAEALARLGGEGERLAFVAADLGEPAAAARVLDAALERFGRVDVLVANHAHSEPGGLAEVTAAELDRAWAVNARASVLLAQAFADRFEDVQGDGRIVLFTSGQHLGPMPGELAYAISKGAIHQMTWTLSDALADRGITVNAVNPGPVDTGYADGPLHAAVANGFPGGRWGEPGDVAKLVAWLASAESRWMTGQVLDAEGGFRRHDVG